MTERVQALTVVLEQDIQKDDAEEIIAAIKMLRGVADVAGQICQIDALVVRRRLRLKGRPPIVRRMRQAGHR